MTTIVSVRRHGKVVMAGDGQVSLGNTVMKGNAKKVRRLYHGQVLAGFAGATADAFTLFERFEGQLEKHQGHLVRAAVELAKDWRTDRSLSRLEAMLAVANKDASLIITGNGDVVEPEEGLIAMGSGGSFAQAAARAADEDRPVRPRSGRDRAGHRRRHLRVHQSSPDHRGTGRRRVASTASPFSFIASQIPCP